jgi:hypothetical protein
LETRDRSRLAQVVKELVDPNERAIRHWKDMMTETSRQSLSRQLTRVIAINLTCLVVFIAFCALLTLDLFSASVTYWNEHSAASVIAIMIAIVSILGAIELAVSRLGFRQQ